LVAIDDGMALFTIRHDHHYPHLERLIMSVSAQVQQALDGIRQTQSLVKSLEKV